MLPERLEELLAIAARENDPSPEALEAYRSQALARAERATRRDDVAILNVAGPLFKRANLFTEFSGATSYDILRRDLQAALDDPGIHGILLSVDSPGGEVHGTDELAKAIFAARGVKPIHAYVSGLGASAAYWIASAADRVIVSDAALLGSIGVVMGMTDTSKRDEARGVKAFQFVSSQSPDKRPDLNTDEGRSRIQSTVDALADVFIAAVAKHRAVKPEKVTSEFGRGGVLVGAAAVAVGMADAVGTFESALEALSSSGGSNRNKRSGGFMSKEAGSPEANTGTVTIAEHEAAVAAARADGIKSERARIQAIMGSDEAKANGEQAAYLAYETDMAPDAAKGILAKAPKAAPVADTGADYADRRASASDLASPGNTVTADPRAASRKGWGEAVLSTNKRRGFGG